jgi:hypothetical protein
MDFKILNRVSLKDNYHQPKIDQMFQKVVGFEKMSMLDSVSGYNQVRMNPKDILKTTFTTMWGTFAHVRMPFELVNIRATSQRDC